jgi:HK97 family phage major capsid protein
METNQLAMANEKVAATLGEIQKKYDLAAEKMQKGEDVAIELKKDIQNMHGQLESVLTTVKELEQKGVKLSGATDEKSFADLLLKNDDYQRTANSKSGAFTLDMSKGDLYKMIKATTTGLRSETIDTSIFTPERKGLRIRDLMSVIPVSTVDFTYFKEGSHTLAAAMVAQGGLKPEQTATLEQVTDTVKKIAVWHRIIMEQLQDFPQIAAYINGLLNYDIKLKEEQQLLKGDGTGNNLEGIMTQATAYNTALAKPGDKTIDTIRRMIYQARKASLIASDAVVMSDLTWMGIELEKDANNSYLFANLQGIATPILWGRPVVVSDSMSDAPEEILVGNFARGASVYERGGYTVKGGMINDDFIRNQSVILAEERIGLAVRTPLAFVKHQLA